MVKKNSRAPLHIDQIGSQFPEMSDVDSMACLPHMRIIIGQFRKYHGYVPRSSRRHPTQEHALLAPLQVLEVLQEACLPHFQHSQTRRSCGLHNFCRRSLKCSLLRGPRGVSTPRDVHLWCCLPRFLQARNHLYSKRQSRPLSSSFLQPWKAEVSTLFL